MISIDPYRIVYAHRTIQGHTHSTFNRNKYVRTLSILRELLRFVVLLIIGRLFGEHIEVVLFEKAQILTRFCELAFLHTLSNVPMHEGALRVHEIELSADALAEHARYRRIVANHNDVAVEER